MIHYSRVINGIALYVRNDILTQLKGNVAGWFGGVLVELAKGEAERIFRAAAEYPPVKLLKVIDGENVNVEKIYPLLLAEARQGNATLHLPYLPPVTFSAADVESLYRYIMGA